MIARLLVNNKQLNVQSAKQTFPASFMAWQIFLSWISLIAKSRPWHHAASCMIDRCTSHFHALHGPIVGFTVCRHEFTINVPEVLRGAGIEIHKHKLLIV